MVVVVGAGVVVVRAAVVVVCATVVEVGATVVDVVVVVDEPPLSLIALMISAMAAAITARPTMTRATIVPVDHPDLGGGGPAPSVVTVSRSYAAGAGMAC